jgi:predicted  nucleic acid-binding Zn-ribbon protein
VEKDRLSLEAALQSVIRERGKLQVLKVSAVQEAHDREVTLSVYETAIDAAINRLQEGNAPLSGECDDLQQTFGSDESLTMDVESDVCQASGGEE